MKMNPFLHPVPHSQVNLEAEVAYLRNRVATLENEMVWLRNELAGKGATESPAGFCSLVYERYPDNTGGKL